METTAALETQSNPLETTAGARQPEAAAPVETQGAPLPEEEPQNSEPAAAEAVSLQLPPYPQRRVLRATRGSVDCERSTHTL